MPTGITKRHSKRCRSRDGGRCNCEPTYQAEVYSRRDDKKIRKTFAREAEAKAWRGEALSALSKGALRAPKPTTVREAWDAWEEGAKGGTIRNRSGDPYKPSALRSYERAMRLRVIPEYGPVRLADLRRPDLQELADRLLADGLNLSTIKVTFLPLRAIFRRAVGRGELMVDPCRGLELPAVRGGRDRIADPGEAAALIAAVPDADRAIWATATYAGLRLGELRALRAESIDLAAGVIRVERAWDEKEGEIPPKSTAAVRKVPIPGVLRDVLIEHRMDLARAGAELAFGRTSSDPFNAKTLQERADAAWAATGLVRMTLHECRHTFASMMIAAGVNAKALSTYMGHANISTTLDRYGHLMPGNEGEAADLLDAYLVRADSRARIRALG